jgi:peptidoglycan hydrolase CwlO-like protein
MDQPPQKVTLLYDTEGGRKLSPPKQAPVSISRELAGVFGRAAAVSAGKDSMALSFTSLLAGMVTGSDDASQWLKDELARQQVDVKAFAAGRKRDYDDSVSSIDSVRGSELLTSVSARQAIEASQAIATALGSATPLDVRHLIAAYPTIAGWHDQDFTTLGIDRLAWCRRFGQKMAGSYAAEKPYWRKYADRAAPVPLTSFNADTYNEKDLLDIDRSVDALALLIASTRTETPLSIGVFGPWGSGKSFFMRHLRKRLWGLAERERARVEGWKKKREDKQATEADVPLYYHQIAQVEFNAWHYNEGNLVASLVDHLFRNLRVLPGSADEELEERRAQVLLQMSGAEIELTEAAGALDRAKADVADAEKNVQAAREQVDAARGEVDAKREELKETTKEAKQARENIEESVTRLLEEAEAVNADAALAVALRHLTESPVVGKMRDAAAGFTAAITDWRGWLARLWSPRGVAVILILLAIPLVALFTEWLTGVWAALADIATAAAAATAGIRTFLRDHRRQFDEKFAELEKEEKARLQQQLQELEQQKKDLEQEWNQKLGSLRNDIDAQQTVLQQKEAALVDAGGKLAEETKALAKKVEEHTAAEGKRREVQANLERLSSALLLDEFITERSATDDYRKQLGFLALVRRDFERLSDLIAAANQEWLSPGSKAAPPLLNRIVLYIDDLDRCSEETVVKVLEVVHLLLAFKLFVCVVAVDPRWVEKCLRARHQFGFAAADDETSAQATVGDYLEKIFQIPIWMDPIQPDDRASVVRSLLGPVTAEEIQGGAGQPQAPPPANLVVQTARSVDGFQAAIHKAEEVPDPLRISSLESQFVASVAPLLSDKPRALIRFVNTYRLLKATLPHIDGQTFVSDAPDSPYRICMSQLAFFTGHPRLAPILVQRLAQNTKTGVSLQIWFDHLPKDLREALWNVFQLIPEKAVPVQAFTAWIPETSKYLFHREA